MGGSQTRSKKKERKLQGKCLAWRGGRRRFTFSESILAKGNIQISFYLHVSFNREMSLAGILKICTRFLSW